MRPSTLQLLELVAGNKYVMEATAIGPHLSLKVWRVGDEEPELPQVSIMLCENSQKVSSVGVNS